jgi:hypothetical protein
VVVFLTVASMLANRNAMSNQLIRNIALDRRTSLRIVLAERHHSQNLLLSIERSARILYLIARSVAERSFLVVMLMNSFAIQVAVQRV